MKMSNTYRNRLPSPSPRQSPYPLLSLPHIVGYMSADVGREYRADLSQLKFVTHLPLGTEVSFDLDHNRNNAIKRSTDDNAEKITLLLKFLLDKYEYLSPDPHFITYRRTLIAVMCSAFGLEPISIVASLFHGSIYLWSVITLEEVNKRKNLDEQGQKYCDWGYKFEQYMTSDLPGLQPDIQRPVVEDGEFSLVYRATLGNHEILYAAQIDGMLATDGSVPNPPVNASYETNIDYLRNKHYVELKTHRVMHEKRQERNFRKYKLIKCYGQCYLAGLKGLIVGYRTDEGIIQKLEWFDTEDIPRYCKYEWKPGKALTYLDYFLTFVKNTIKKHVEESFGPNCSFKTLSPISLEFSIDYEGTIKVNDASHIILPDWFIEAKKNMRQ